MRFFLTINSRGRFWEDWNWGVIVMGNCWNVGREMRMHSRGGIISKWKRKWAVTGSVTNTYFACIFLSKVLVNLNYNIIQKSIVDINSIIFLIIAFFRLLLIIKHITQRISQHLPEFNQLTIFMFCCYYFNFFLVE